MTLKASLDRDGVAKIPGFFPKSDINKLRQLAWLSYRNTDANQIQYRNGFPALLFFPSRLKYFNLAIKSVVEEILGPNVLQLNDQYYFRMPGDGDQFAWHQDICFRTPKEKFNQIETGYLQTAIIVDPMDDKNGGIEFVLGSHKWGELDLVPRDNTEHGLRKYDDRFKGTVIHCEPGDLLIWSVMIIHGSKPNESDRYRSYYMNGFAKTECVVDKSLDFPVYLKDGKLV